MRLWIISHKRPALPCGYWVEDAGASLRLFNPEGVLLQEEPRAPVAASALDWRAWQDAWEIIEREVVRERSVQHNQLRRDQRELLGEPRGVR